MKFIFFPILLMFCTTATFSNTIKEKDFYLDKKRGNLKFRFNPIEIVGDVIHNTGEIVGDAVHDTGVTIGDAIHDVGENVGEIIHDTGERIGNEIPTKAKVTICHNVYYISRLKMVACAGALPAVGASCYAGGAWGCISALETASLVCGIPLNELFDSCNVYPGRDR